MPLPNQPPPGFSLEDAEIIYQYGDRVVWKVGNDLILKRTEHTYTNSEAITHHFIANKTPIPVPRVYGEWLSADRRYHYLLEARAPGTTLGACWGQLTSDGKLDIALQIAAWMKHLARNFRGDRLQTLLNARLPNNCFVPRVADSRGCLSGRWSADEEIFEAEFKPALQRYGVDADMIRLLRRTMPPCSNQLALTHCDLYLGNIMVEPRAGGTRGVVTAIIDWESAGYWPEWFQYARITHGCSKDDTEWKYYLSKVSRDRIKHADHGRVWWDTVQLLLYQPGSLQARAWLLLLIQYLKREVGRDELNDYQNLDGRDLNAQLAQQEAMLDRRNMLNNRGGTGDQGYYSTAFGRWLVTAELLIG
jgi:thiamine kinase-like enzyme